MKGPKPERAKEKISTLCELGKRCHGTRTCRKRCWLAAKADLERGRRVERVPPPNLGTDLDVAISVVWRYVIFAYQ